MYLAKDLFLGRTRAPYTRRWQPNLPRASAPRWGAEERAAVDQVIAVYRAVLKGDPQLLAALADCHVSPAAIDAFHLGYAPRTFGNALPGGETHEGAEIRGRLMRTGLYRPTGHAHLAGAVVAPIADAHDRVVDLIGRRMTATLASRSAFHLSVFDPPQGVFNLVGLATSDEAVLCGDLLDALAFWSAGVTNVTTTVGPRGFTDAHLRAFTALSLKRVVIAFPTNPTDDRLAQLVAQALDCAGIEARRLCVPRDVRDPATLPALVRAAPVFAQSADAFLKEVAA